MLYISHQYPINVDHADSMAPPLDMAESFLVRPLAWSFSSGTRPAR